MEAPEPTCPAPPARDQPAPTPGPPGAPGGQASPHLTLGPVLLPPEQGLAPTVFLKALPIPLYHTVPPGGLQPRAPLVTGSLDGGTVPLILSPVLQPEGPGPTQVGKPVAPTLTVNIVGTLPVLSPGLGPALGSPGKVRNAGKYLCPHCGRDCLKPSVLEKHIRSHTGERPFPCATCGIAFKTQSNLYKHRRTQTHLNNSRLSSESEGPGGGLLEEGDKAGEPPGADGKGENKSQGMREGASERPLSPGARVPLVAKNLDVKTEAVPCSGSAFADRGAPWDSAPTALTWLPAAGRQPWRKLPEQKSQTAGKPFALQRQQATAAEKSWDAKAPEGRLRKCESTDSGYLSRSDSAEQPPAPCSPLHSLSEHSAESEGEGGLGAGPGSAGSEPGARGAGLELEKRRLEERISRLISHNQAVMDDAQLDNVRPRKTGLSKQGSIDLPTPYTYKDSFHFDIRALEPGRWRALSPTCSTWTTPDKSRPLFFHSIPTQLSTTVECVPVTRSNSLPFVEGSRTWLEPLEPRDPWPRTQKPLSPRPGPARLGCRLGLSSADVPGHPRALVRQAAVEDLPGTPAGDAPVPEEDKGAKRTAAREAVASKGRAGGRKCGQRRLKMFSQEKWQVYGDETFKRIYQKMKASPHGGKKTREVGVGSGAELGLPLQKMAAGSLGTVPTQDRRTLVHEDISTGVTPEPWGNPPAVEASLVTELPKHGETVARTGDGNRPRLEEAVSSPASGGRDSPCSGSRSPLLSPNGRLELGWQLPPAPGSLKGGDLEAPRPVLPDPKLEGGGGNVQETCLWAQTVLRWPSSSSGEDKLPSERKKLKVEDLHSQEEPEPVGAESPRGPTQAASLPFHKQDADPGEVPGGSKESAGPVDEPLESSGDSLAAASVAPKRVGLRDKAPPPRPAAPGPGEQPPLPTPPLASRILPALAGNAFPPKYLLSLPQAETPTPLPVPGGPRHSQDTLCSSGWPEERASFVGSGLGTSLPPSPASGLSPGEAHSILEDPSCSRPWDGRKGAQVGADKGDRMATSRPAARASHVSASGAPRETTFSQPTPTCEAHFVQDLEGDSHHICRLRMGSTLARARPSGDVPNLWVPSWEVGEPPENAPEDPPSESLAGPDPCSSLQPGSFLTALTRPQGVASGWPELALSSHSGTSRSHDIHSLHSPFPSLKAEPRLTWCCLSRSVPLPAEQTAKAASVYLALHFPGSGLQDEGPDGPPGSSGGWTRTSPGGGEPVQMFKLPYPTVSGVMSQDQVSEPQRKKGLPRRRTKMSHGNSRQRKLRINPKRYKGNFLQSCVQLRASRLRKATWVRRRSHPPSPLEGLKPCRTLGQPSSETAGLYLLEEPSCATSESPPCCRKEEKKEDDCRQTSGTLSLGTSSRTVRETDKRTAKDISPSAGEHGDCTPHSTAAASGVSLQPDTCLAVANDTPPRPGRGLDLGLLETQLLPSQDPVSIDPTPCIFSDAQGPFSLRSKGTFPHHDIPTSVAAICVSLTVRTDHITQGIHSAEPQDHSQTAGRKQTPSSPDSKATEEGRAQTLLPGRPSSGQRISDLVPLGSPEKTHLELPASGPSSTSSHQEEGRQKTCFPPRGQYGCGETTVPCPPLGSDGGKCQVSELITQKGSVVPSNPGQPIGIPEAPSKSLKKRSLEGMRKQTRVEFTDTSSDDEDRLVIEI
ncbi:zinc finger protein 831 [Sapajus apella]|uniref:Zinc finger protein 831 n=1 Tax=Sapajus apella TaxID=9515 RepID=A0A6J3G5A1_SAPAP|nr:zinc finger protein 831 [Sapajus apella]XP_032113037.1 zinc finger protein 831 [Sapajus apella]XP_032113038.1 zinc finger protein 831 [Sapajus apella]